MIYQYPREFENLSEMLDGTKEGRIIHEFINQKELGPLWEPIKDPNIATSLLKYAYVVPLAAVQTSIMYYLGEMLPKNEDKAVQYARMASNTGD